MTVTTGNAQKRSLCDNLDMQASRKLRCSPNHIDRDLPEKQPPPSTTNTLARDFMLTTDYSFTLPSTATTNKVTFKLDFVKDVIKNNQQNFSKFSEQKLKRLLFTICERGTPESLAYIIYESNLLKNLQEDLGIQDELSGQTCLHIVCGADKNKGCNNGSPPPAETDEASSPESLLNKAKILLNLKPDLIAIKDKRGILPLSYVSVETRNQWFRPPICLVSDDGSTVSECCSKQQQAPTCSMKSYYNSNKSSGTFMDYSAQEDEVSQLTQSIVGSGLGGDNSHHLEEEEANLTEHEMVVHITAILVSRLEALMQSRQENNGSSPSAHNQTFGRYQTFVTDTIKTEVDLFVRIVSAMYREVPYHSFDHAHHVVSATNDLLDMLVPADDNDDDPDQHPCSHDLFNNKMSHLALVFAALIHDVDHTGIVNAELAKDESDDLSMLFGGDDSTAEKNSIVVGCMLLMRPELKNLQQAMFQSDFRDFEDFRSIVHKLIMTTDICNRQTTQHLKDTWCQAFGNEPTQDVCMIEMHHPQSSLCCSKNNDGHRAFQSIADEKNDKLRALVVMFYMMRAADVLHLMEDWDTFLKWSNRCYMEFRAAYQEGKGEDPGSSWYENQIGFLDFYVIPLAKNLHFSGAFGEFGEEFVNNILSNKEQWLKEGKKISSRLLTEVDGQV